MGVSNLQSTVFLCYQININIPKYYNLQLGKIFNILSINFKFVLN